MRFYEEVTAIPEQERLTDSTVYVLAKKELLAGALPGGGVPKQARFPTVVQLLRMSSLILRSVLQNLWWILVQCCGTLRFSDHRGLRPADVLLDSEGFVARLTR